jgi:hypothetical protein
MARLVRAYSYPRGAYSDYRTEEPPTLSVFKELVSHCYTVVP